MINKWEAVRRLLVTAQNFEFMQEETAITDINVILDEYAEHLKEKVSGSRNSTNNAPLRGVNGSALFDDMGFEILVNEKMTDSEWNEAIKAHARWLKETAETTADAVFEHCR